MATQLQVGDYAHTSVGSDRYPYVVTYVSPSGKTVKASRVRFDIKEEFHGKCFGLSITSDMVENIESCDDERTFRLTTRRGRTRLRSGGTILSPGFESYMDPHF